MQEERGLSMGQGELGGRNTLGRGPREKRQHSAGQLEGVLNIGNFLPICNHANKDSGHRGPDLSLDQTLSTVPK